ncbi:hypothetical protein JHD48_00060 [Sulfurimonas sp. SAG-AH-194-I05]|nr:hypothetical protein [Sulfurimonas sp. SAG-AH-194-I05]MDF1874118.1 hypothetical protein [Sulfurimonas sp. SAG-AH-194-I05]
MIKIAILFVSILFSGCSMKDVSKPIIKYTIEDNTVISKESVPLNKVLKIAHLKSPKYIKNNNIWYKKPSFEVNTYLYAMWNEDFVHLVEEDLAKTIYNSGLFTSIFTSHSKIHADVLLEGALVQARQILNKDNTSHVVFTLRLYAIDAKTSKLLGSHEFKYLQNCETTNAKGAIVSYNKIIKNLNKDVLAWLKKLMI